MKKPFPHLRRPESLRSRIMVATATTSFIALIVVATTFLWTLDRILVDVSTSTAAAQADQVASLILNREVPPSQALSEISARGSILQILDSNGRVIAYTDPSAAASPLTGQRPAPGASDTVQVTGGVFEDNELYVVHALGLPPTSTDDSAVLFVASRLANETSLVTAASAMMIGFVALSLIVLTFLIDKVLTSTLHSVEHIRASVAHIRSNNLSQRVPVPLGGDEIARLATTMNEMLARLDLADSTQRAFISNASHELRSPLTTMRMVTETSQNGIGPEGATLIHHEVLRLQGLVEDLLTLAKVDDTGAALEHADVDVDDLLLTEVGRARSLGPHTVTSDITAARVTGDPGRIAQVMRNLVDNALRHAHTTVHLACGTDTQGVYLHVDNDGNPIPESDRDRVFDRFTRLEESRARDSGGSGLGLAIVRGIVEAHGGTVTTGESETGWCRFTVRLPAQRDKPSGPTSLDHTVTAG